ncbi:MAG TPA: hypothetical protein VFO00_07585 [Vitreimonas sp.]|nr:hypothetical protein [Vitreimonas sp.]
MKLVKVLAAAGALQAMVFAPALAQQSAPTDEEVIVQPPAPSNQEEVRTYVQALTTPTRTRSPMPRWYKPLCLGVVGMQAPQAQVLNDRIGELAQAVRLQVEGPGCRPNVLIHFTRDAAGLARGIADQPNLVSANNSTGNSPGNEALQEFLQTQDAVRWWHVSRTGTDGVSFGRDSQRSGEQDRTRVQEWSGGGTTGTGEFSPSGAQQQELDQQDQAAEQASSGTRVREVSRIRGGVMEMMDYVIIVIDANQTGHTTVGALADYVAMVALAQINPEAETAGAPTILNLFNGAVSAKPTALTSWDLAYLRGLYASSDTPRNTRQQEGQIVRRMIQSP